MQRGLLGIIKDSERGRVLGQSESCVITGSSNREEGGMGQGEGGEA